MPHLTTDDGVKLYYEETGKGIPIIFIHEFAGDFRSWEQQVRHFAKYYRCITFNARGYPPSDVPKDQEKYSQERARDDIRAVLDALKIDKAHIVGLSMGGFATLHFGFRHPSRALSLVVAGCGYGAEKEQQAKFRAEVEVVETDRGGKSTFHGPGQLVCYPILDLKLHGKDVKRFCRDLEEALIRTLAPLGVAATRIEGLTGIWLESPPRKIASKRRS